MMDVVSSPVSATRTVLLTGATGFVGPAAFAALERAKGTSDARRVMRRVRRRPGRRAIGSRLTSLMRSRRHARSTVVRRYYTLSGRETLERTAAALGARKPIMIEVPFLSPQLRPVMTAFPTLFGDVSRLYAACGDRRSVATMVLLPVIVIGEAIVWRGAVQGALARRMRWLPAAVVGALVYALVVHQLAPTA